MPALHEGSTTVQTITLCRDPGNIHNLMSWPWCRCTPKTARYSRCRTTHGNGSRHGHGGTRVLVPAAR
eukprot:13442532-Alexandrium_andersonii.AAC.1